MISIIGFAIGIPIGLLLFASTVYFFNWLKWKIEFSEFSRKKNKMPTHSFDHFKKVMRPSFFESLPFF